MQVFVSNSNISGSGPLGTAFQTLLRPLTSLRFWLVLLLLVAWALRLFQLGTMSLWWDEALSWDRATNSFPAILANTIQIQTVATRDLHPPLYFALLRGVTLVAGTTEFALRFLSTVANILTLALFVPFTRVLFCKRGSAIGLLTVLMAAVSPFYVWYAQEARPYALVLFFSLFSVYALLKWLKTDPQTWRDMVSRWSILVGLSFLASLATLYLSFVLLPLIAATLLIFGAAGRHQTAWRARLGSPLTALAALLVVAFVVVLALMPRETDLTSWDQAGPRSVPLWIMLRDVWNSFSVGLSMFLDQAALLDWFLLALWLVGVSSLIRLRPRDFKLALFVTCYLLLPALALQLGSIFRPLYLNSRHLITTSPAFYVGLAVGVYALGHAVGSRAARASERSNAKRQISRLLTGAVMLVIAGIVVGGALVSLNNLYFDATFAKDDHKAWAQFLRERLRPDDYLLLVAPQAEKIVQYYAPPNLQWESLPHLGQTRDRQEVLDRESVLAAYHNHPRVWLLELHQPVADPTFHIADLLNRWGALTEEFVFRGISTEIRLQAYVYNGLPKDPAASTPLEEQIRFTSNLELVGYETPEQAEAGTRAVVNLYWRLRRKLPKDGIVSLRVVDELGNSWGQWDAPPVGTEQPITSWQVGKMYRDQHDLLIEPGAPPGRYKIEIEMYSSRDAEPWKAFRGSARVETPLELATIEVVRPAAPRDPDTLLIDEPRRMSFGDALEFVGYDLEASSVNPGSDLPVTLYFQIQQTGAEAMNGSLELVAPGWQFWNTARTTTLFTLDLSDREIGDIVQARVLVRVPGSANAGAFDLRLALDKLAPQTPLPTNAYTFGSVQVDPVARSMDMPPIANPVSARFGGGVELLGYALDAPDPLKPGDRVRLTLYWRALAPIETSLKVFVHLIDGAKTIYGQRDQLPLDGARPTTSWLPGEIFTDVYEFDVAPDAPPGPYQLEIGFYSEADFARSPVTDAQGNPIGDHFVFEEMRVQ